MLDQDIKDQLIQYLALLEEEVVIQLSVSDDPISKEIQTLVNELDVLSDKIHVELTTLPRTPSFTINRIDENTGITFAGLPLGHEFSSLVLALLQVSGRPPKVDDQLIKQIKDIKGTYHFETYISLSCHNCPDVVQALNLMSVLNPSITHTMIDGSAFKHEVEEQAIMAVPTVHLNGNFFESGRTTLEAILKQLGQGVNPDTFSKKGPFDVLVVGGGPAGAAAAIYAARKGIKTGLVADRFGGQVMDTLAIENFISVSKTEGPKLVAGLEAHVKDYNVDLMIAQKAKSLARKDNIELTLENGAVLKTKTLILATGAKWRQIGVPGEMEYKNKGIAYCPHCDGPMFSGKRVAVIGGGNSGIEAAIDLAGIVEHVTVLEFLPELKADKVLQERLYSLDNIQVITNAATKSINGDDRVTGLTYINRKTGDTHNLDLAGVFILIGLTPNTEWLGGLIEHNAFGEIIVDRHGATNVEGVFAAGDCTNSPYKQIVIAMGSGATASLGAFDYLIRH